MKRVPFVCTLLVVAVVISVYPACAFILATVKHTPSRLQTKLSTLNIEFGHRSLFFALLINLSIVHASLSDGLIPVQAASIAESESESESELKLPPLRTLNTEEETSQNVPNRKFVISTKDLEKFTASSTGAEDADSFDTVLKLIPSYKYFKIIGKEYSSRSTAYTGLDNPFAPLQ